MLENKAFLHSLKLICPYQRQISKIEAQFNGDYAKAWYRLRHRAEKAIDPETEWIKLRENGIHAISREDPEYPFLLTQITDPPSLLYYRGTLPRAGLYIAVVGSRKMSAYGRATTEYILKGLAGQDAAIVSGLAYGVDAHAHRAALNLNFPAIAVLGSGIDPKSVYPPENKNLAAEILASGGALVSELPPGTGSLPAHFPMRNRIISGLSRATIIIEADLRSGALITGRLAIDQNRDVFAVPGSILESGSRGAHTLIKEGAKPLTGPEDILLEYGLTDKSREASLAAVNLDPQEEKVLHELSKKPLPFDEIMRDANISAAELNAALAGLEIKNFLRRFPNNSYALI